MKNKFKFLFLLILIVFMSGCVKYDIGMKIGKDGSVTIEVINAIQNEYSSYSDIDVDAYKDKGYESEKYETDDYTGYKFTKKYKNIDDISSKDSIKVELSEIETGDKDIKYFFQKKSGFLSNTYIANFTLDFDSEDSSASQYASSMQLQYHVTLPTKAKSHNATSVSEDGKTLTWNLKYGEVNEIKYEFSKTNTTSYVIVAIIIIALFGGIIFFMKKKKKQNFQMPNNMINNNFNPINQNNNQLN